jgi:alpha-beta hydrolase superfamily lysophospholipase
VPITAGSEAESGVIRIPLHVDVSDVAPPGCLAVAVEVVAPAASLDARPPVIFCYPGGGMSRRYFDLDAPGYSFAQYACERGFVVILADHPGVGGSDVPDDAWTLSPETVALVNATAVDRMLGLLASGSVAGLPPMRPKAVVAVAHSAGAHLLIHQQAAWPQFDGVAVLGWCGRGLPEYLDAHERALASLPGPLAPALIEGAKRRHAEPLAELPRGTSRMLVAGTMPAGVHQALVAARAPLLAVVGYASMVPGSAGHAAARIDVPVFIGVGERDIAAGHHAIPAEFPASGDVTLFVLAGAGHNHNVEPGRERLWARIISWAGILPSELEQKESTYRVSH